MLPLYAKASWKMSWVYSLCVEALLPRGQDENLLLKNSTNAADRLLGITVSRAKFDVNYPNRRIRSLLVKLTTPSTSILEDK